MSELEQASAACWKALGLAMLAGVMVIAALHNRAAEAVVVCGVMKMVVWLSIGASHNREVIRLMEQEL